jgi:hypothetical protein
MPTICEFFGIIIRMYYDDHNPPHFHAFYGDEEALIAIQSLEMIQGSLPRRARILVIEWAIENRTALLENWRLAREHQPLRSIVPLE